MKVKKQPQTLIRMEPDIYEALLGVQKACAWPVTLKVLASFAARNGLSKTRRTFNGKTT